jgi:polysaccharide pyruvyl transferase WcaK-like protein
LRERKRKKQKRIGLFGHFGQVNFGNESTLNAVLYHVRRYLPDAEVTCICTDPEFIAVTHKVNAVSMKGIHFRPSWLRGHPLTRALRKIIVGLPSELYRWMEAVRVLKDVEVLVVPGTGLLTDAYGQISWGPYSVFKWSIAAKVRHCKLLFVSVGAGPIYTATGRWLTRSALSLADFRSYRDEESMKYIAGIGVATRYDRVRPDLAFSLPETTRVHDESRQKPRPVVGIGLMEYAGRLSVEHPSNATYLAYLESLVLFVRWLLARGYDVRLLIGDIADRLVVTEFRDLLKKQSVICEEGRIIDEPVLCVQDLLAQLAATDIVVATRFHNLLLALALNKPVISISFHQKCVSLVSEMGLLEYCQDIHRLSTDRLIEQFCEVERNAETLKPRIKHKTDEFRRSLDEQYSSIFKEFFGMAQGP